METSTLSTSNVLVNISSAKVSLAYSFTTDVIQGMLERIRKWWKEDMYHGPKLVHEKLLVVTQKEESCWNTYMLYNFHVNCVPTYYKALLPLPHIEKKVLFV